MPTIRRQIATNLIVEIEDMGERLNEQFFQWLAAELSGSGFDVNAFIEASFDYFDSCDESTRAHDKYFENINTGLVQRLSTGQYDAVRNAIQFGLSIAHEWEESRDKRLHKGTPYYFLSVISLRCGDLETGFLQMHQALIEDKITENCEYPESPARAFVALEYENQNQFLYPLVKTMSEFLESKLDIYVANRNGLLTLDDLKRGLLENHNLLDIAFLFVFGLFHWEKYIRIEVSLRQNAISSLMILDMLFDFCLITENILRLTYDDRSGEPWLFGQSLQALTETEEMNLGENSRDAINLGFTSFLIEESITQLVNDDYQVGEDTLEGSEADIALTYGIRNMAAHKIENHDAISRYFEELAQMVFNALCFAVERSLSV